MAEPQIRVIARAATVLDCFLGQPGTLGITDISRLTGLSKSTVHSLVTSLVETDFLAAGAGGHRYRLGPKVVQLGNAFIESTDLRDMVHPTMVELRDLTQETVTLHVPVGDRRTMIAQVPSKLGIRRMLEVGLTRPIYLGAVGMTLMGGLSDEDIRQLLKRSPAQDLTATTVTDPTEIIALVRRARADGYTILNEQTEAGVGAIALPIHDHLGVVIAAIVISGPLSRWNPEAMAILLERMTALTQDLDRQLGKSFEVPARLAR